MARILVIDSYDSFVYNIVQYLGELGAEPVVVRNDQGQVLYTIVFSHIERIVTGGGSGDHDIQSGSGDDAITTGGGPVDTGVPPGGAGAGVNVTM